MSDPADSLGIQLEATLPLGWSALAPITLANSELQQQGNIALLRALSAIETAIPEHELHAEATQKTLERIEAKLDIVFLLLARLAGAQTALPAEKKLALAATQVSWVEPDQTPAIGQEIEVDIYLNPRLPQALKLAATVSEVNEKEGKTTVSATLQDTGDELSEWLTRTIFRYHRRALQARRQSV